MGQATAHAGTHSSRRSTVLEWLTTTDHKKIGVMYIVTAFTFFILGGLMALARGEADIAGSHLWDEQTDQYNVPFVQRVLPGERVSLVPSQYAAESQDDAQNVTE